MVPKKALMGAVKKNIAKKKVPKKSAKKSVKKVSQKSRSKKSGTLPLSLSPSPFGSCCPLDVPARAIPPWGSGPLNSRAAQPTQWGGVGGYGG